MENDIQYIGEHLLPGQFGKLFIFLAFVSAFSAAIAYAISTIQKDEQESRSWRNLARGFFITHGVGVMGIVAVLFYIISNFLFEYRYAWEHSSLDLPTKYILSCFWEGQEGSFLLWMFWHTVLGGILIYTAKKWESPVMAIVAITQVFLASMLLGLQLGDIHIGSNPFLLLRETMDAPIFSRANYLDFIEDGNGLNPLLQNYWMTIHPPTLFLGFALTIVPFGFSIAALWKNDYKDWVQPTLLWTLAATLILGIGILMGGAWAYEALTFGGFWAWDPVENASLVPWLTLVAGLHTLLVYKFTKHALKFTFGLFILTFLLILYSTFLTRSGILGDTSVHAFTDLGMSGQLVFFMVFFIIISLAFLLIRWRNVPTVKEEEDIVSREFWMFIGALVFLFSAILISISTSIPVFNAIFGTDWAPPTDAIDHHNKRQVWIAVLIGVLSASVQFLRYKRSDGLKFAKALIIPALVALVLTVVACYNLSISSPNYILMFFAAIFAVVANTTYIISVVRAKPINWGSSIAHVGFGLILLGVLISNHNKEVISINNTVSFGDALDEEQTRRNILLLKGEPKEMGEYRVTYLSDTAIGPNNYFNVSYQRMDEEGNVVDEFILEPNVQINERMGNVANPSTKHYLTRDIYTHITSLPIKDENPEEADTMYRVTVTPGDTFILSKAFAVLREEVNPLPDNPRYERKEGDIAVGITVDLFTLGEESYIAEPVYVIRGTQVIPIADKVDELGLELRVVQIRPESDEIVFAVAETEPEEEFIIMQAMVFPYINVLWLGWFVCCVGFVISMIHRTREYKRKLKHGKA